MNRCANVGAFALTATLVGSLMPSSVTAQGGERLRVTPAVRSVVVGDSLRIGAQLVDARGAVVPNAIIRFNAQGGRFQGAVDSLGWVRAGSPGTVPIAITAIVPGGRPVVEKIEVRIVPGLATSVTVAPKVSRMLAGQRLRLAATARSATGDAREDVIAWTSSNAAAVRVADGVLTAVAPGSATITARAASGPNAAATINVQVVSSAGVTASLTPDRTRARQGDVVRFALSVKD